MSQFRNVNTGVVVSVDDSKDDRYTGADWESADKKAPAKTPAKKATSSKSSK